MSRTLPPATPAVPAASGAEHLLEVPIELGPATLAARHHPRPAWLAGGASATARGLAFCALAVADVVALAGLLLAADLLLRDGDILGHPQGTVRLFAALALIPLAMLIVRWLATLTRTLSGQWCGVPIPVPYRVPPAGQDARALRRLRLALADPATWRDLLWAVVNPAGAFILAAVPAALVVAGLGGLVLPTIGVPVSLPRLGGTAQVWQPILLGVVLTVIGLWAAPALLTAYGMLARTLLGPTRKAELALRVHHLAQTRSDTIDASAAELRRIERDLHDGAQARLVALGMTLDTAEQLLDTSPETTRALLAEARAASVRALAELRSLVRGIHPPVLADRGLAAAVQALALDCPVRVQVAGELDARPPAPVESAAYFAVSELVANVAKHAAATEIWIDLRYTAGMLRIGVRDDGQGGADPARGTGLRGIERRLSAFDGVLALTSPAGGPTVASMEIPCGLAPPGEQQ
jgi:signal transduction histidine kinase